MTTTPPPAASVTATNHTLKVSDSNAGDTVTQNVSANDTTDVQVITQKGWGWGSFGGWGF